MDLDSDCGENLDDTELDSSEADFANGSNGYQKFLIYSKYVPYASSIDKESDKFLAEIKANLGKVVLTRDLKPGCYFWVFQLERYIFQNGHKFKKEDHIIFIKLFYELLVIPDLEFFMIDAIARVLTTLLRKRDLISRRDITLDWLPLYQLYKNVAFNKWEKHGLARISSSNIAVVCHLIKLCRTYFPVEATQEILDEVRPLICPYIARQMNKAIDLLDMFLPTLLYPEEHEKGFHLWFKELMQMYESIQMMPPWESQIVFLFSRLSESTIGYIDWTPYIPMIFTRLLRSFQLPLQMKLVRFQNSRENYNIHAVATLIVAMLGGANRTCQNHLARLFTSLESFYHPSNSGSWNVRLQQFLARLSEAFVRRLRFERRLYKTWAPEIPSSHRLTDENITEFVNCMKPCVLLSMFAKSSCVDAGIALKHLACLRPELIIPAVLERFYSSVETLTEPHRLVAVIHCLCKILPSLVEGGKFNSNDPANVLPILTLCLPGIDSNDIQKTLATFQLISSLVIMVPLVDCTPALQESNDLTEFERELCSATSQFEDFVLQFMDRCFLLIENTCTAVSMTNDCSLEIISTEEEYIVSYMSMGFNLIMNQSSPEIRKVAVDKLCNFVTSRILGTKDSGYLAAKLVNAAVCQTDCDYIMKNLLNKICYIIEESCPENLPENFEADKELLYNMLLLQELVCCDGRFLLPYRDTLLRVLRRILRLQDKDGRLIMCHTLKNILRSLTNTFLLEHRSANEPHGVSEDKTLPLKLWGKTMKVKDIKIEWHVGNDEEVQFAQDLVNEFLTAEIDRLTRAMEGKETLHREQLQKSLAIINAVLLGVLSRCPRWVEGKIPLVESCEGVEFPSYQFHQEGQIMMNLNGENLRSKLLKWLLTFSDYAQTNYEDNILAMNSMIKIYHHLLFFWGTYPETLRRECKYWTNISKTLCHPLRRHKDQFRFLFIQKAYFYHQMRVVDCGSNRFSELHQKAMIDLFSLSISHYSEVRCMAQWVLGECFFRLPFSYRAILPQLQNLIENVSTLSHDKLKGLLHVLLGDQHSYCLLARREWDVLLKLWPIVIKTPISDRPSTNLLLDSIVNRVRKHMDTFLIYYQIPDRVLKVAETLWTSGILPLPSFSMPSSEEIATGLQTTKKRVETYIKQYNDLVHQQVSLLETSQLHWQNFQLGCELLVVLIRFDIGFPVDGLKLLLNGLVNDSCAVRNISLRAVGRILYQLRPQCVRIEIDPSIVSRTVAVYDENFDEKALKDNWDNEIFIDHHHLGFYCWQKSLTVHAPAAKQKLRSEGRETLNESEKLIYDTLVSEAFMEQAIKYLSAEVNKDQDKLCLNKCRVYKSIFRNFEDTFLPHFLPHVERLSKGTLDSEKRCALELIAGMVAGSKYWKYAKLIKLQEALAPIIKASFNSITVELQSDWCRAVAYMTENKDPRRSWWLVELLLENLLSLNNGSFVETNRLNLLCSALSDYVWKVPQLRKRILDQVQPHLAHAYQNVRDELGRLLSILFLTNGNIPPFPNGHKGPCQRTFIQQLLPQLEAFEKSFTQLMGPQGDGIALANGDDDDAECKAAVSLLKTICRWLRRRLPKTLQFVSPEIIDLLPVLCQGESYERDQELRSSSRVAIACIGYSYLSPEMVPVVLANVLQLSKSNSWRARKTLLEYLQILIFSNLFNILSFPNIIEEIKRVVVGFLHDPRAEVQQIASQSLSGLFHCQMLLVDEQILNSFTAWSNTPLQKGKAAASSSAYGDALRQRHAGILGMSAFVNAHPYDIADGMPEVLVTLGRHLHDPQPIMTTVRSTITNFWRTHHDNWHDHKLKFTEDQLSEVSDLLVSPNYYA
ncbi:hypothetical protein CHUAL_006550 [Chamberlinius hualienensis]